ncbi:synaptotagmin-3-like isoform X2 [Andrographis paniculata]|nr:synaptotagmin-3-like isoform X2 [Andrographis paniculata]XP_051114012.1 synaptotagmin-3-like isoform X2 [Andrographis paniculata]XP_051114013.1 synaptotagmin-3-like isoform X2 [Andrographis paniculata]
MPIGLVLGFFVFIYLGARNVEKGVPVAQPLDELSTDDIIDLLPELPLWVTGPDYERVDWFNKFFQYMWPYFDKAACGIIKTSAEATFAEYIGKYCIKSIYFKRLTLGDCSPKIQGLKAQDSRENELVLDLSLRWAGNSDIVVAIKLLSLQLTVQLVDVQISAAVRMVLRPFVPTFPCFSSIAISLMEKPKLDFGLKVMGGDMMSIPGIYQFVQEIVAKQVAKLYMWPQTYEIDILDSSIGAAKKPVGILHVKVVRAQSLLKMDFLGTSDPYVKLSLTGEKLQWKKTTVVMNNLNPVWNEDFKLIVKEPKIQVLQLLLFDWEKVGAHDYLGMQLIPLDTLVPYEKKEFALALIHSMDPNDAHNKKSRGRITVELTFVPFLEDSKKFHASLNFRGDENSPRLNEDITLSGTGLLLVTVIEAEDVEGKHHNNPYATVIFRGDKRNTKTIKKTRDPIWSEEFQFVLDEAPANDQIHVEVKSKKRWLGFMSKESLGYVDINLADVVSNGHINEKYNLINSRNGIIHLNIRWKVI